MSLELCGTVCFLASNMSRTIVVVDDEPDICSMLRIALKGAGYDVLTASDGEAGKALIEKTKPDLVLLDVKMPKMNGYEVMLAMQKDPKLANIPVVIMTSLTEKSSKGDEEWRKSLGVADFLSKPFDANEMLKHVSAVLGNNS